MLFAISPLERLAAIFPRVPEETIHYVLESCDQDSARCIIMLENMGDSPIIRLPANDSISSAPSLEPATPEVDDSSSIADTMSASSSIGPQSAEVPAAGDSQTPITEPAAIHTGNMAMELVAAHPESLEVDVATDHLYAADVQTSEKDELESQESSKICPKPCPPRHHSSTLEAAQSHSPSSRATILTRRLSNDHSSKGSPSGQKRSSPKPTLQSNILEDSTHVQMSSGFSSKHSPSARKRSSPKSVLQRDILEEFTASAALPISSDPTSKHSPSGTKRSSAKTMLQRDNLEEYTAQASTSPMSSALGRRISPKKVSLTCAISATGQTSPDRSKAPATRRQTLTKSPQSPPRQARKACISAPSSRPVLKDAEEEEKQTWTQQPTDAGSPKGSSRSRPRRSLSSSPPSQRFLGSPRQGSAKDTINLSSSMTAARPSEFLHSPASRHKKTSNVGYSHLSTSACLVADVKEAQSPSARSAGSPKGLPGTVISSRSASFTPAGPRLSGVNCKDRTRMAVRPSRSPSM